MGREGQRSRILRSVPGRRRRDDRLMDSPVRRMVGGLPGRDTKDVGIRRRSWASRPSFETLICRSLMRIWSFLISWFRGQWPRKRHPLQPGEATAMETIAGDGWLSRRELADRYSLPVKTPAEWATKGTGPPYAIRSARALSVERCNRLGKRAIRRA
jgi:hypothetical protein